MKKILSLLLCVLFCLTAAGCGAADKLELDRTVLNMTVGDTEQLNPGNVHRVHWESSDPKICTVAGGSVNAKAAGTATVTASLEDGSSVSCLVTVEDKLITAVNVSSTSLKLEPGKTIQLSATYTPFDASRTGLTWSSQDESVAVVDENGYVTGVSDGVTVIICTSENGIEGSCAITVSSDILPDIPPTEPPIEPPTEASTESESKGEKEKNKSENESTRTSYDFIFPDSSERYLSREEVSEKLAYMSGSPVSSSFAQDAVNEIYARNGYVFRSDSLRSYYQSRSWYHADPYFGPGDLNDIELYNIGLFNQN